MKIGPVSFSKLRVIFVIILFTIPDYGRAIRWLALQHSAPQFWNTSTTLATTILGETARKLCQQVRFRYGFTRKQTRMCKESIEIMVPIATSATLATNTCQKLFANRRWNCTSIRNAPEFTPDLTRGTREQAFVYALSSAALTYSIARACASGTLYHCTCATPSTSSSSQRARESPTGNFKWGGCSDNVRWSTKYAKRFIDSIERDEIKNYQNIDQQQQQEEEDEQKDQLQERKLKRLKEQLAAMNLHNNRVGRRIIDQSLSIQCKCHGVSGSCNIKTCWRALPALEEVGARLQRRFTAAVEVLSRRLGTGKRLLPATTGKIVPTTDQLIYINKSPDYCTKDERLGSLGTSGRLCNVSSSSTDSCRYMCCGRGYRTIVEEKIERCHCKYYWCCYVKCQTCRTLIQMHECN